MTDETKKRELDPDPDKSKFHPLNIDVITQIILAFLPINDLVECRQVCRKWREVGNILWDQRSSEFSPIDFSVGINAMEVQPTLLNQKEPCRICRSFTTKLSNYMEYLEDDKTEIVCSNFEFEEDLLCDTLSQRFLDDFGTTVRKLGINFVDGEQNYPLGLIRCSCAGSLDSLAFRQLLMTQCTQLEELALIKCTPGRSEFIETGFRLPDDDFKTKIKKLKWENSTEESEETDADSVGSVEFAQDLIKSCPLLETLEVSEDEYSSFIFWGALSESQNLRNLTDLTMSFFSKAKISINILKNLRLKKLKFLNLTLFNGDGQLFKKFLTSQSDSLQSLTVSDFWHPAEGNHPTQDPLAFPDTMKKLKFLKIRFPKEKLTDDDPVRRKPVQFQPINYLQQFPNLKTLIFCGNHCNCNILELFFPLTEPHPGIQNLQLPNGLLPYYMHRVGKIFPKLKKLTVVTYYEESLRMLWTQWPDLEELEIMISSDLDSFSLDSVITGLPPKICLEADKRGLEMQSRISVTSKTDYRYSSIANLAKLRKLRILDGRKIGADQQNKSLGDLSLVVALSKLPNLELFGLRQHHDHPFQFSRDAVGFLMDSIPGLQEKHDSEWTTLQCLKSPTKEFKSVAEFLKELR